MYAPGVENWFGDRPHGQDEDRRHPREQDWEDMLSYLDKVKRYGKPKPAEKDEKVAPVNRFQIAFALVAAIHVAVFLALPMSLLMEASLSALPAFALSLVIWLAALPAFLIAKAELWDRGSEMKRDAERELEWRQRRVPDILDHDDGDNDLDEIRSITSSVSNIDENLCKVSGLDGVGQDLLRVPAARAFASTVKDYVLLSFWDCHEKRIPPRFNETVIRTSAAWTAYIELMDEGKLGDAHVQEAGGQMDTVFEHAQKAAYRNFIRVDSKVNGEAHIFDMPDAPRALSNAEKLSVAAAMAQEEM